VARDEIRARLNLLEPGVAFQFLRSKSNADEIQTYMRDRGYYKATVEHAEIPDPGDAREPAHLWCTPSPGDQAHVANSASHWGLRSGACSTFA